MTMKRRRRRRMGLSPDIVAMVGSDSVINFISFENVIIISFSAYSIHPSLSPPHYNWVGIVVCAWDSLLSLRGWLEWMAPQPENESSAIYPLGLLRFSRISQLFIAESRAAKNSPEQQQQPCPKCCWTISWVSFCAQIINNNATTSPSTP